MYVHCLKKYVFSVRKLHFFGYFRPHLGAVYFLHWNCETKQCKTERMFWGSQSTDSSAEESLGRKTQEKN